MYLIARRTGTFIQLHIATVFDSLNDACVVARAHIGKIHTHTKTHSALAHTHKHTYACAHHEHTNDRTPCPHLRCLPAHACKCTQLHTYIHTKTYVHLRQVLRQRKFACQQYRYGLISFFFAQCMISSGSMSNNLRRRLPSSHSATSRCLKRECVTIMLVERS
jgi:hypothetical protein